jgi:hypothetical protein
MQGCLRGLRSWARSPEMRLVSAIRTNAAAAMLGVSPNTLRNWERRFGYPAPRRTEGGHRQFELAEIETLCSAFERTQDVATAIAIARDRGADPPGEVHLRAALAAFCCERADRVLEESLAVRTLERTVELVLLAAVGQLAAAAQAETRAEAAEGAAGGARERPDPGRRSPEYCFGWRHATAWLAAAGRLAPPAHQPHGVLIFDGTEPLDLDALHVQALELFLRRAGVRVLTLPTDLHPTRLGNALRALRPRAIVLGGPCGSLDAVGRLIYTTRQSTGEAEVLDFRGALPDTGASTVGRLPGLPATAARAICAKLAAPPAPSTDERGAVRTGDAQARLFVRDARAPSRRAGARASAGIEADDGIAAVASGARATVAG